MCGRIVLLALFVLAGAAWLAPLQATAQYFGKNTVRYQDFDFKVLRTEHFDIYYYDAAAEHIELFAQLAERWHDRLSFVLNHRLTRRQPIVIYASHPHFRQTNTTPADIGEATGGFTEIFRNRVVMPFAGTLGDTDHVLGHELVHAFQFDMTGGAADPERFGNIPGAIRLPLWLVEGMAEYLSLGPYDSHSAIWLRGMVLEGERLTPRRLHHPLFQPYRQGHGLIAYIGGRFGNRAIGRLLVEAAADPGNVAGAFERTLDVDLETLLADWQKALEDHFGPMIEAAHSRDDLGRVLRPGRERGLPSLNLAPSLSPDGSRLIFLARPQRLLMELYLMDVATGEIVRRITRTAIDPHFEALQFVRSAGEWSPDGQRFAYATIRLGQPAIEIIDGHTGERLAVHSFAELGEVFNASWSPDGRRLAFSAMRHGITDLYTFDLETGALEQLTEDRYASLQPVWAPDGASIVFVTDRFDFNGLPPRRYRLARLDLDTGAIAALPAVPGARHSNPRWSADGGSLYFLADLRGTANIHRLDLESRRIAELTHVQTGVTGLSAHSPALSVAGPHDSLAFTLFDRGGFALMLIDDGAALEGTPVTEIAIDRRRALLPPVVREDEQIARFLDESAPELRPDVIRDVQPYRVRFEPEYISQVSIGGGTGAYGTYAGGGVSVFWSDMLGDHGLLTQLQTAYVDGELLNNTAAAIGYQNRTHRWNWNVIAAQIPLTSGRFASRITTIDGERALVEQAQRIWEINRTLRGSISYPFDRATRVEFGGGIRHISFDAEVRTRATSLVTGERISVEPVDLPTPSSLTLGTASMAWVHDTAAFGATGPVLGQRIRLELGGVAGDLHFMNPLVDYRAYWMPFERTPLTIAARAMHFGRYGGDAEDPRLRPLMLNSPNLVRGYQTGFQLFSDPVFEKTQGSRIAVGNIELRMPLTGVRGFIGGAFAPPLEAALFFDSGVAWTSDESPSILGGDRGGITSYGVSLRTNFAGLVFEFSYVNPRQFQTQSWHWQFNIMPGF